MKTTLKLVSPSTGFLLGSSTSFRGLESVPGIGLMTANYRNETYSLSTAIWNLGLTTCLIKDDGTPLDIPEGSLAILPDVPEVTTVGPVLRIPAKSILLRAQPKELQILTNASSELFRIILKGNFAYIAHDDAIPKLDEWTYLVQASSALKRIIDAGIGKSKAQQEQLILNYHSEMKRIVSGFSSLCDSVKEPKMQKLRVYRLDIAAFDTCKSLYLYQRAEDMTDVQAAFEQKFRKVFPDIKAIAVFLRHLDFKRDSHFDIAVDVDYMNCQTDVSLSLSISSIIIPERAANCITMNSVFLG